MQNVDLTIVGAGSAGLTLALLLAEQSLRIAVIEKGTEPEASTADYRRVSALNQASRRILTQAGAWSGIVASAAPYQHMEVWEADSFARITFDAHTEQETELGWICDNEQIRQQLYQQVLQHPNIHCYFNHTVQQFNQSEREALITLDNQQLILSRLVVGADGVNSFLRQQQHMPLIHWDYEQHALVATIATELPHQSVARQVFRQQGPLALLPLQDSQRCSIVWSTTPQQAEELMALTPEQFNQALTAASQSVLGRLSLQTERQLFPLRMRYASEWVKGRVVLVADAAHSIHPLAGQGMNLGLLDVAALAELICQQIAEDKDISEPRMLRQYERWRKAEAQTMIAAMEAFKRGFSNNQPLLKLVRGAGMKVFDQLPWLKRKVITAALGNSGNLPLIARPAVKRA